MTFVYFEFQVRSNQTYDAVCACCHRDQDVNWMPEMAIRRADGIYDGLCTDCAELWLRHTLTGVQLAEYLEQT